MNLLKRISTALLMITVMTSITGCQDEPIPYAFRQDKSNIEKVEICTHDFKNGRKVEPLVTFSGSDADEILADISTLECYWLGFDASREFGEIIICITYFDGEVEVIGTTNNGWIEPDGDWNVARHCCRSSDLRLFLRKYVDPNTLEAISKYL